MNMPRNTNIKINANLVHSFSFHMLFLQLFQSLEGKEVTIELRNDIIVRGILQSADQYYNFRIKDVKIINNPFYFNHKIDLLKDMFIRGSSIRYIRMNNEDVDLELLHDATRRYNQ